MADPIDSLFDDSPTSDPIDTLFDSGAPDPVDTLFEAATPEAPDALDNLFADEEPGILDTIGGKLKTTAKLFYPSGQQELLNDPDTAGVTGALLSPLGVLGIGDTAIAESATVVLRRRGVFNVQQHAGRYDAR